MRRLFTVGLLAVCLSGALGACGSSGTPAKPGSVAVAPVRTVATSDGTIGYRSVGRGQALVLIMGYGGTMDTWDPRFVDALAQQYRVVTFDNAGIGRTSPLPTPLTIDAMSDQTNALIGALKLGRTDVLGWSMGGLIAQALAVLHPASVNRVVLAATFPGNGSALRPPQSEIDALTGDNPARAAAALFPADQMGADKAFSAAIASYPRSAGPAAPVIAAQGDAVIQWWDGKDPAGRAASGFTAPTLIADGTEDRIVPVANDHDLADLIRGSKLILYPDAGHAFLFQTSTTFRTDLTSFLGGSA